MIIPVKVFAVDAPYGETTMTREQRLTNAVQSQQLVVDDVSKAMLAQKCAAAQKILTGVQERSSKQIILITNTYSGIQKEMLAIELRMSRQGADASEIELLIGKLQQKLDQFTISANTYGTSLDDTITVDCAQRPELFKAGLVMLRAHQGELQATVQNLYITLQNAQRETFEQLKNRLRV